MNTSTPKRWASVIIGLTLCVALSACQFPRLHRVTVQQGNVLTQEMVNKLKPGMSRSQVAFVMGEPILKNPFENDRWVYIYTVELPGRYEEKRQMVLYFKEDVLAYFTGDIKPQTEAEIEAAKQPTTPAATEQAAS